MLSTARRNGNPSCASRIALEHIWQVACQRLFRPPMLKKGRSGNPGKTAAARRPPGKCIIYMWPVAQTEKLHPRRLEPMTQPLQIHTLVSMPFAANTYIVWRPGCADALVFDPGLEPDLILHFLQEHGLRTAAILNTHGHADHIGGNEALKKAYPEAPLIIGAGDAVMLADANANLSAPFGLPIVSPPADRLVREGDAVDLAGITLEVLD